MRRAVSIVLALLTVGYVLGGGIARAAYSIMEYPSPTSGAFPNHVALGPDGNLWFTESEANKIAMITPGRANTEYSVPTAGSQPTGIAPGPDGKIWFTEESFGRKSTAGRTGET